MSDLEQYIEKRKQINVEFAEDFESGYTSFKFPMGYITFLPPTGVVNVAAAVIAVSITLAILATINSILESGEKLEEEELLKSKFRTYRKQA